MDITDRVRDLAPDGEPSDEDLAAARAALVAEIRSAPPRSSEAHVPPPRRRRFRRMIGVAVSIVAVAAIAVGTWAIAQSVDPARVAQPAATPTPTVTDREPTRKPSSSGAPTIPAGPGDLDFNRAVRMDDGWSIAFVTWGGCGEPRVVGSEFDDGVLQVSLEELPRDTICLLSAHAYVTIVAVPRSIDPRDPVVLAISGRGLEGTQVTVPGADIPRGSPRAEGPPPVSAVWTDIYSGTTPPWGDALLISLEGTSTCRLGAYGDVEITGANTATLTLVEAGSGTCRPDDGMRYVITADVLSLDREVDTELTIVRPGLEPVTITVAGIDRTP